MMLETLLFPFYIEFSQEKINGKMATTAHGYLLGNDGSKYFCRDIIKHLTLPAKGATRSPPEICRHLECALTHFTYPPIYDKSELAALQSYCPSYKTILDERENASALQQELENVLELCSDSSFSAGELDISDRSYGKLPSAGGAVPIGPGQNSHRQ